MTLLEKIKSFFRRKYYGKLPYVPFYVLNYEQEDIPCMKDLDLTIGGPDERLIPRRLFNMCYQRDDYKCSYNYKKCGFFNDMKNLVETIEKQGKK